MTQLAAAERVSVAPAEPVVVLDGISVRYRTRFDRHATIKEMLLGRSALRRSEEFVALDGIDLQITRGEVFGIIGANGAGKTTLLNVIARIIDPSSGRLRIRGRMATLIDLLGGFHGDLTGRENALLRGALLGISRRDMIARYPEIAAFADIGEFADAPMRTWSAGMIARMAFSIATSVDADILVIDEALGAGDASFQKKCAARMAEFRKRGITFVIVSHDVGTLMQLANRIVWLDHGRMRAIGDPQSVVSQYLAAVR